MFRPLTTHEARDIVNVKHNWALLDDAFGPDVAMYLLTTGGMLGVDHLHDLGVEFTARIDAIERSGDIIRRGGHDVCRFNPDSYFRPLQSTCWLDKGRDDWVARAREVLEGQAIASLSALESNNRVFRWANWFMKRYDSGYYDPYLATPRTTHVQTP